MMERNRCPRLFWHPVQTNRKKLQSNGSPKISKLDERVNNTAEKLDYDKKKKQCDYCV